MTRRTHIGKYEILERIAEGGFGVVYKARDPFIKRLVAVKTCSVGDQNLLQRFFREAEIAGNLHHRNVTIVHDFGVEGDVAYLVQEYLSGEDLLAKLRNREPLTLAQKLDYLLQAAIGLGHAHSKGVIHRDVKPGNIRVLENGLVKIMDFGIAKLTTSRTQLTQKGMTVGTVGYLSPEQIRDGTADQRSDIFSYGVVAYELLAYRRPFYGRNLADLLPQILDKDPEPLGRVVPDCPPPLAALVGRCLEKEPQRRYQSFDEVIAALRPILGAASRAQRALEAVRTAMLAVPSGAAVAAGGAHSRDDGGRGAAATATATPAATSEGGGTRMSAPGQPEDTRPVPTISDPETGGEDGGAAPADAAAEASDSNLEVEAERIAGLISSGNLGTALEALEATVERHAGLSEEDRALEALGPIDEPVAQPAEEPVPPPPTPAGSTRPLPQPSTRRSSKGSPAAKEENTALPPAGAPAPDSKQPLPPTPAASDIPAKGGDEAAGKAAKPPTPAGPLGERRSVPVPLLVGAGALVLLLLSLLAWWAPWSKEEVEGSAVPVPTPLATPELPARPSTGTLIVVAAPWGVVDSVTDGDGSSVELPVSTETPLRLDLAPATYRAAVRLPGVEETSTCEAAVDAGQEVTCHVVLQEVDTTDYFKQAGWWR